MNAALQVGFFACNDLMSYIEDHFDDQEEIHMTENDENQTSISKSLFRLIKQINIDSSNSSSIDSYNSNHNRRSSRRQTVIDPLDMKLAIDKKIPRFKGTSEQNDCSEFLMEFLDSLHDELNRMGGRKRLEGSNHYGYIDTDKINTNNYGHLNSFSMYTRSSLSNYSSSSLSNYSSSSAAINGTISAKSNSSINWRSKGDQWWSCYKKSHDSIVKDLFEGAVRSIMTCLTCGGISGKFETFSQLIIPLPSCPSSSSSSSSSSCNDKYSITKL
jgi:ubiquitin C-terminal hydrolase